MMNNPSCNKNPISCDEWIKHFKKIYIDGIPGPRGTDYINNERKLWDIFCQDISKRGELYDTDGPGIDLPISYDEINIAIPSLNPASAGGLDGLNGRLIKNIFRNNNLKDL